MNELNKIFTSSDKLKDIVMDDYRETVAYELVNDILAYFKHDKVSSIADYNITWLNGYIRVNQEYYKDFIDDLLEADNCHGILSEEIRQTAERLAKRVDFWEECTTGYADISENKFCLFEKWFDENIEKIAKYLLNYLVDLYDYQHEETLFEYFIDYFVENAENYYYEPETGEIIRLVNVDTITEEEAKKTA